MKNRFDRLVRTHTALHKVAVLESQKVSNDLTLLREQIEALKGAANSSAHGDELSASFAVLCEELRERKTQAAAHMQLELEKKQAVVAERGVKRKQFEVVQATETRRLQRLLNAREQAESDDRAQRTKRT